MSDEELIEKALKFELGWLYGGIIGIIIVLIGMFIVLLDKLRRGEHLFSIVIIILMALGIFVIVMCIQRAEKYEKVLRRRKKSRPVKEGRNQNLMVDYCSF